MKAVKFFKTQEVWVSDSHRLCDLRDAIVCPLMALLNDVTADADTDTATSPLSSASATHAFPSGFFFIENTFYNDRRHPQSINYSRVVLDWVHEAQRYTHPSLGVFSEQAMETTLFSSLHARIGVPFLFTHFGACEHVFLISRICTQNPFNPPPPLPYTSFLFRAAKRTCQACDELSARYITRNDRLLPEITQLWCSACYRAFHYSTEGFLIYDDFEVYPYFDLW